MRRPGRFLVLCLLLMLLPLRSLLAAGHLSCEPASVPGEHAAHAHHHGAGTSSQDSQDASTAKPCKLCAPCCLAAAPPPALLTGAASPHRAVRAAMPPASAWASAVPRLPDPPPRA